MSEERWWESFYDDAFADVVMDTGADASADATTAFLIGALQLAPGQRVLDQGCGLGRISLPLARRGIRVVGVDAAESYVERARLEARAEALPCEFFAADALEFRCDPPCDGAFNWWSSFGYLADDDANIRMLQRAYESLRPGGRFALDYYSTPRLMRELRDHVELTYRTRFGEATVVRTATMDFAAGTIRQRWEFAGPDGRQHQKSSLTRTYMPHELCGMLRRCGFVDMQLFGSAGGEGFGVDSPRCVVVTRRPE